MKLFILTLLISTSAIAAPTCKISNQWKCDTFDKYDYNQDEVITHLELDYIFNDLFKTYVEDKIANDNLASNEFMKKLAKPVFKYHVITGKLINSKDFTTIWGFIKFLISNTNPSRNIKMDFSDFVLALNSFDVKP